MADHKGSDNDGEQYVNDPRIACKYGTKCYQTNPIHQQKYKHPPSKETNMTPPKKKFKMDFASKDETEVRPSSSDSSKDKKHKGNDENQKENDTSSSVLTEPPSEQDKINDLVEIPELKTLDLDEVPKAFDSKEFINKKPEPTSEPEQDGNKNKEPIEIPAIKTPGLGRTPKTFDPKEFIKEKFLVDMPEDFYIFWDFCKKLKAACPQEAIKDIGLTLVGPYDVLAGKFNDVPDQSSDKYLIHWRYFYDPPEFQTVLKGDNKSGFHLGYFRDAPKEMPVYLASNSAKTDGIFRIMGDNIFAAVYTYLEDLKKTGDPFKRMSIRKFQSAIKKSAEELDINLLQSTPKIKNRDTKIVTRSFSKMGIVVPYNRKTQVGYRDLGISNKELVKLLNNIQKAKPEEKQRFLSDLQNVLTNVSIATDECDFGTGIELGLNILAHGVESLNQTVSRFLATNYKLIEREEFAKIAEAHMKNRRKDLNLSII